MQTKAVFWLMSELSQDQLRLYQKNKNIDVVKPISGIEKKELQTCSNPNNCPDCKEKIQEKVQKYAQIEKKIKPEKQSPICGLKICLGKSCPFESCGKKTDEELKKVLQKKEIFEEIEKRAKE
jgi:hypothetical protein